MAGTYDVDFVFNPFTSSDPAEVTANRYKTVQIGEWGYASFSCPFKTTVPMGVIAYYVTGQETVGGNNDVADYTYLNTSTTRKVPATTSTPQHGTGVILEGDEGTYEFYETDETFSLDGGNKLWGTGMNTYTIGSGSAGTGNTYVFTVMLESVVSFYKANKAGTAEQRTYPAFKAFYSSSDSDPNSREYFLIDFSSATSIADHSQNPSPAVQTVYDLQSRRVPSTASKRGLYIVNGRKVVVR